MNTTAIVDTVATITVHASPRTPLDFSSSEWSLASLDTLSEERGGDRDTEFDLVYTSGGVTFRYDDIFALTWTQPTAIVSFASDQADVIEVDDQGTVILQNNSSPAWTVVA